MNLKYWVDLAEYDLETAQAMLRTQRFLYVGFMCHQAVEKMLKAYFCYNRQEHPPKVHGLRVLAQKVGLLDIMNEEQIDLLNLLEPLNIEARYPKDKDLLLQSLSYEKCNDIIQKTKGLLQWIKVKFY